MHAQAPYRSIKRILASVTYTCLVLICLEGCQGCYREDLGIAADPGGIPNVDNTCYVNAVLQVIAKLYPGTFAGKDGDLAKAGQAIVDKIGQDQDCATRDEAENFYAAMLANANPNSNFVWGKQGDAAECLEALLAGSGVRFYSFWSRRVSHLNNIPYRNYYPWQEQGGEDSAVIRVNFPQKSKDDRHITTMQSLLEFSYSEEDMVGANQCEDNLLNRKVDAQRENRLEIHGNARFPCAIQLVRFRFINGASNAYKVTQNVANTMALTIPVCVQYSPNGNLRDLCYRLQGFIVHLGNASQAGHYVAYINQGGQWKLYDDERVRNVSRSEAATAAGQAYLYFYRHIT